MAWPRWISTAKPRERPDPFGSWWYGAKARGTYSPYDPPVTMTTEILHRVCGGDREKFDLVNYHLRQAFLAGMRAERQR